MNNENRTIGELVDVIREIVRQELSGLDSTILCQVKDKTDDHHYDVYIVPDTRTVIHNVVNMTVFDLKAGDYVYVYKIKNQLSNSFICYKVVPFAGEEL